jgi:hypothetical protein
MASVGTRERAREHWAYQGVWIARGYGPTLEGQRCYWFRREGVGTGGTTFIIPVDKFWSSDRPVTPPR